jgi:hypothetical protein
MAWAIAIDIISEAAIKFALAHEITKRANR